MAEHADLLSSIGLCVAVAALLAFAARRLRQPLLLAYLLFDSAAAAGASKIEPIVPGPRYAAGRPAGNHRRRIRRGGGGIPVASA